MLNKFNEWLNNISKYTLYDDNNKNVKAQIDTIKYITKHNHDEWFCEVVPFAQFRRRVLSKFSQEAWEQMDYWVPYCSVVGSSAGPVRSSSIQRGCCRHTIVFLSQCRKDLSLDSQGSIWQIFNAVILSDMPSPALKGKMLNRFSVLLR